MLLDLVPDHIHQGELDLQEGDACETQGDPDAPDRTQLMAAMDRLNGRFGKGTLHMASSGLDDHHRLWGMRQERRTPHYTTRWDEVAVARA